MRKKRTIALVLASVISVMWLSACNSRNTSKYDDEGLSKVTTTDSYPQKTDITLRYWMPLNENLASVKNSMNDTYIKQYLEEATGIKIQFEHPVVGQDVESFNILLSSGDAPDIIEYPWSQYPGGPQRAMDDKLIEPLNSYIDKVSPNLKKILTDHPDWARQIITDEGNYYQYPFIRPDDILTTYMTFMIRKDLLNEAGLSEPVTLDDWNTVLYKFKEMGVETPLMLRLNNQYLEAFSPFMGVFGIAGTFYHDKENIVKYGLYEPAFADYVRQLKKWYDDGILDREFVDVTTTRMDAIIANGKNGAYYGGVSTIARYKEAATNKKMQYVPLTIPVKNKGERAMYAQKDFPVLDCAAISADSKNKELAARFLDYGYSPEGHLMYNFGKEGVSYEDVNGNPTYLDTVMDKEKNGGLSIYQSLTQYIRGCYTGPFEQDARYIRQFYKYDEQKLAFDRWGSDTLEYKLPFLYMSSKESKQFNDLMSPINTYCDETLAKLISGKLDISYLDTYFSDLKRMGIEDAIALKQAAYDRYLNRELLQFKN